MGRSPSAEEVRAVTCGSFDEARWKKVPCSDEGNWLSWEG
jgi:hypothetical protein